MYVCIFSRSQQFSATFCSLMDETEANRYCVAGCIAHGTNIIPMPIQTTSKNKNTPNRFFLRRFLCIYVLTSQHQNSYVPFLIGIICLNTLCKSRRISQLSFINIITKIFACGVITAICSHIRHIKGFFEFS